MEMSNSQYIPKLAWYVVYSDGTILRQYDDTVTHNSEDIDRPRLREFTLIDDDGVVVIRQRFKPGQKLIYRTRNVQRIGQGQIDKLHILGWEQDNLRHIAFIHESNLLIEMGDFVDDDQHRWYYPHEKLPHDDIQVQ